MNTPTTQMQLVEKLTQAESALSQFFRLSLDLFGIQGTDGYFKQLSPAWEKILGWTEVELRLRRGVEFVHPDDVEVTENAYRQCHNSDVVEYENRYRHKNGSYRWLFWRVSQGDDGLFYSVAKDITATKQLEVALSDRLKGWVSDELTLAQLKASTLAGSNSTDLSLSTQSAAHTEIKQRLLQQEVAESALQAMVELEMRVEARTAELQQLNQQLRAEIAEHQRTEAALEKSKERYRQTLEALCQSEARYRAIVEDQTELICRFRPDGTITFVNDAYCRYFNKPPESLIGHQFLPTMPSEDRKLISRNFHALSPKQPINTYEHRIILDDGEIRWQQWSDRALFDEQGNFTECQAVGRDITQLKQAEAEVRKALERERELSELRSSFVSLVSHEFRTPLTTIQSSAELLKYYGHRFSDEKKQNHFRRIQTAVSRMTQLLNDVLIIGKAEAGKLKFEPSPVDIVSFCHDIVESIQISIRPQHTIKFVMQGDFSNAYMDERLLGHIITNLLSNAIKYSPQGGTVEFDLISHSGWGVFRIKDTGIGIPQPELEHLFDSFGRASNVGTIPGTGLGLAIVKQCVDLHQGKISVESELGVGTTFTIRLPLNGHS
ncbi:MAG TPA: PAS domain S-box protein [Coleofasciculaceae cyanobacterium]